MANLFRDFAEARYNRSLTELGLGVGSKQTLLANLKRLFPERGDQLKLAKALSKNPATINRWFNGSREPNLDDLDMIAKQVDLTAPDLIADLSIDRSTGDRISPRRAWLIVEEYLPKDGS